ncbi:Uncharacterized protein dnl_33790 [Desulfonema limicola]|uniref:Uncharacterized protein n=1 Tax=Desulfonema limicola TaxID=45656 RepID=A0A975B940_9BACT|nr:hypothetical protein [Desulfonema limicola]QTA81055.1 Uncharacterized protein dnl_33790 [Desulfonema limicola]
MNKKKANKSLPDIELPQAHRNDLRGKQSVRATFKLSEDAIKTLSIVATHLGIKQKSLFDHLIEDIQSLKSIARECQIHNIESQFRVQKTYVLSRRTLSSLDETSKSFNAPRDILVEYSIKRLIPIISKERKRHELRKQALKEFEEYLGTGEQIMKKLNESLGTEDPVYTKFEKAVEGVKNAFHFINEFIEKGKSIEDF